MIIKINNKFIKTNSYPDWLVPIELAKKLKEIGLDDLEFFTENFKNWYRADEIFYFETEHNTDGYHKTYSAKEVYLNKEENLIPTYSFEQAFSWFRKKGYEANISYDFQPNIKCFVGYSYKIIINCSLEIYKGYFISYEIARKKCLEDLIKYYKNENI